MIGLLPRLVRAVLAGIGTACETLIPGPNIHGYRLDFAEALAEAEAEQDVSEPRFPPCPDVDKCKYCPTNDGIDCTLSCNKVEQDWLAADSDQTSSVIPPAAVEDPAGGAPASAPLPSAGSPSVPAGVSARTPDIAAPSAGLHPVGTIRILPNAVAVRIIGGAWSVIWHQWHVDEAISRKSWIYHDGSPMAERITTEWTKVRDLASPTFETGLDMGVSVASEFYPQHRTTRT